MGANCCRLGAQNSVRPEEGLVVDGQMRTTSSPSLGEEGGRCGFCREVFTSWAAGGCLRRDQLGLCSSQPSVVPQLSPRLVSNKIREPFFHGCSHYLYRSRSLFYIVPDHPLPTTCDKSPQRFFLLYTSAVVKNTIRDGGSTAHTV